MIYLPDTSAFSDLMRKDPRVTQRLQRALVSDQVVVCTIVRGEIRFGIDRLAAGWRKHKLEALADALFAALPCEPIPVAAGDSYASLKVRCQLSGAVLGENDAWIAVTAMALGAVLVTHDDDFGRIAALTCEDWAAP